MLSRPVCLHHALRVCRPLLTVGLVLCAPAAACGSGPNGPPPAGPAATRSVNPAPPAAGPQAAALADHVRVAAARGVAYLRRTQAADGTWTPGPGPAVTGLVLAALLDDPAVARDDEIVTDALRAVLVRVQADGSIRDGDGGILANYNTAICVSALSRLPRNAEAAAAVAGGVAFLRSTQWQPGMTLPDGTTLTAAHPFAGGAGYGRHGRPDMSNTQFFVQALHDAGVTADDEAVQAAVTFLSRCQATAGNAYFPPGTLADDGGFIYATSINAEHPDIPVSYANPAAVEAARAGRPVSGLRGYGSVTYAGFKSFVYAELAGDDPRVVAALRWIGANYTLKQNPGMPADLADHGLYYYYLTHARALAAWGRSELPLDNGKHVAWADALVHELLGRQRPDGSWINDADRWMEDDPALVTAYALHALRAAGPHLSEAQPPAGGVAQ